MQNIEIKAPVPDRAALEHRIADLGAELRWARTQRDVFFHVPAGYLKLRRVEGEPGELIAYVRASGRDPRPSDYDIATVEDAATLEHVLTRSLGVRGVVEKVRTLYLWRHTRIHLDAVAGLGEFMELETVVRDIPLEEARAEAGTVIERLALDRESFLDRPYLELQEARS
jgi:predicted adenylyl cyclase CyaB